MTHLEAATLDGGTVGLEWQAVEGLAGRLHGQLLVPDEEGYDEARRVWNGMIDKRPAFVVRCGGGGDVAVAVAFAREHELLVSVRAGGHNYAGKAVCDGGLMIDLSPMKEIRVDPEIRTAHAEAGLRLGEFDRATQAHGLATTLGVNTDTGIAGLTLGGGLGWLAGQFGLACDNLLSVEVVTADGEVRTASPEKNPDLFWGVRGAGANLGVVTSFEYRLHPVGPVFGGMAIYPLSVGREALKTFDAFSSEAPDEVCTIALTLTAPDGSPAVGIAACYSGPLDRGEEVLKPLRTVSAPLADLFTARPYVEMQALFDEAWPPGRLYYNKSHNLRRLDEETIDRVLEYARNAPTSVSNIAFQHVHGAAIRLDPSETAFPHRYDHAACYVHPATDDPADVGPMIAWARECWQELQPFAERAVYVNALEDAEEEGLERVREAYGPNYEQLAALKRKYDPTNFFRLNQNIPPAAVAT